MHNIVTFNFQILDTLHITSIQLYWLSASALQFFIFFSGKNLSHAIKLSELK